MHICNIVHILYYTYLSLYPFFNYDNSRSTFSKLGEKQIYFEKIDKGRTELLEELKVFHIHITYSKDF